MEPGRPAERIGAAPTGGRLYDFLRAIGPLRKLVRSARGLLGEYRVPAWYLEGAGRTGENRLSMVFAGHLESKNYFAHLAFDREYSERFLGATWLWNAWRSGVRLSSDMVVTHERSASRGSRARDRGFSMPCWIGTETVPERAAKLCRTSENIKSDVRRLTRNGLTYEITRDPAAIAGFYSTMYVPYVQRTHGSRAMVTSWEEYALELERAELMVLKKDGEMIAGNLLVDLGEHRTRTRAVGVKDGDDAYVKMGAVAALYYFEIVHLKDKGCKSLHYGASRPFLKDGVLAFKKKYGAQVVDNDRRIFRVRVARYSDGVKTFLRDNPFLSETNGCFYANFFVNRNAEMHGSTLKSDLARYSIGGTKATRIYNLEKATGPLDPGERPTEPTFVELNHDGSVRNRSSEADED